MDFTNILTTQSQYLTGLGSLFGSGSSSAAATDLSTINSQLSSLATNFQDSAATSEILLNANMQNIVDDETTRLNTKKSSIDQAMHAQARLVELNQSYSKKYSQYIYIIIIIVIALVLFLGITMIQQNMENPPTGFFTFLQIIILGTAFIYIVIVYNNMQLRSNMNYDELAISTPNKLSTSEIEDQNAKNVKSGKLLASQNLSGCAGSTCCGNGTIWDVSLQVCVEGFTSLGGSPSITIPFTEYEFTNYSSYK